MLSSRATATVTFLLHCISCYGFQDYIQFRLGSKYAEIPSTIMQYSGSTPHPAYNKRVLRLDERWGLEEVHRVQQQGGSSAAYAGGSSLTTHPAYTKRAARLDSRWGKEEQARVSSMRLEAHPPGTLPSATSLTDLNVHPAYAKRVAKLDSRWGIEEQARILSTRLEAHPSGSAFSSLGASPLNVHPAYAKRKLDSRWGSEEQARILSTRLDALPSGSASSASSASPLNVHPAYAKRKLDSRWGSEEQARIHSTRLEAYPPSSSPSSSISNPLNMHPAYAKRKLDSRWGTEEHARIQSTRLEAHPSSDSGSSSNAPNYSPLNVHPAYAKRKLDSRWGNEEHNRLHSTKLEAHTAGFEVAPSRVSSAMSSLNVHPAYAKRVAKGIDGRWGKEEVRRMAGNPQLNGVQISGVGESTQVVLGGFAVPGVDSLTLNGKHESNWHPAYRKRVNSIGYESRWGPEEPERVASVKISSANGDRVQAQVEEKIEAYRRQIGDAVFKSTQRQTDLMNQNSYLLKQLRETREKLAAKEKELKELRAHVEDAKKEAAQQAVAEVVARYENRIERLKTMLKFANEKLGASVPFAQPSKAPETLLPREQHPAYEARAKSAGFNERWGNEEIARIGVSSAFSDRLETLQELVEPNIPRASSDRSFQAETDASQPQSSLSQIPPLKAPSIPPASLLYVSSGVILSGLLASLTFPNNICPVEDYSSGALLPPFLQACCRIFDELSLLKK